MRTEDIPITLTERLRQEALRWQGGPRPAHVEVPGPGQISVWDFPRPPALQRVFAKFMIRWNGRTVVQSEHAIRVLETASPPTYYFHRDQVNMEILVPGPGQSYCEWKGPAQYWDLRDGTSHSAQAAWSYPNISQEYAALEDYIGFYASRVDACTIDDEQVEPQPGQFYAGWVTSELTGPWKGGKDSTGW